MRIQLAVHTSWPLCTLAIILITVLLGLTQDNTSSWAQAFSFSTSWMVNSAAAGGVQDNTTRRVQMDVDDCYVTPEGAIYTYVTDCARTLR